jgi:small subunit ribosomal protein S15
MYIYKDKNKMNSQIKRDVMAPFQLHETDTGSATVQVAVLTTRIKELTEHLKKFAKDYSSKRSMINMVNKRKRLLRYIEKNDVAEYKALLQKLNLRK